MVQNSAEYFLKCTLLWLGGNKLTDRCSTGSAPPCFRNICASFAGPTLSMPFVKIIARQARSTSRTIRQTLKKRFSARCSCCGRKGAVPSHVRRSANVARAGRPGGGQGNADRPFLPDQMPEELNARDQDVSGCLKLAWQHASLSFLLSRPPDARRRKRSATWLISWRTGSVITPCRNRIPFNPRLRAPPGRPATASRSRHRR